MSLDHTLDYLRTRYRGVFLLAAAAVPLLLCAVLAAFRESLTTATAALLLVLFVVAVAASGDRVAGVLAALSSGVWFDFFLTQPYQRFTIDDPNDIEVAVLLVLVGAGVTELALWGRRQQHRASRRTGYLDGILQAAERAAGTTAAQQDVIRRVGEQIREVLDLERCRFVPRGDVPLQAIRIDHDGVVRIGGQVVDVDRVGLPTDQEIGLVVRSGGVTCGHYLLTAATRVARPSLEQRRVAVLLADQVGTLVAGGGPGYEAQDAP